MKKKISGDLLKKYEYLDGECNELHRRLRASKEKKEVLECLDRLIKNYDIMSGIIRPSWAEKFAIRHLVKSRDKLRRQGAERKPGPHVSEEELEKAVSHGIKE